MGTWSSDGGNCVDNQDFRSTLGPSGPTEPKPWKIWFAWYPVKTNDTGWAWFRRVGRKTTYGYAGEDTEYVSKEFATWENI